MPVYVTFGQIAGTAVATAVVGFVVWLATVPLRRSVTGLIASVVVTGPLAVLGGIGWALLLGPTVHGPEAALVLAVDAVAVAAAASGVFATRAHRRFARSQRELRAVFEALAEGGSPSPARPLLSELEVVRRDLTTLARGLVAERDRGHARDAARRELIGWVSDDLHAPLTVLRAMSESAPLGEPADVRAELDRLVDVVDDLADLAAAGAGSPQAAVVVPFGHPAVLSDVLGDLVAALTPLLRLRDVGVRVEGGTGFTVGLVGPAGEDLGRRLLTLLVEAVRHASAGSTVTVEVACRPGDEVVRIGLAHAATDAHDVRMPLLAA